MLGFVDLTLRYVYQIRFWLGNLTNILKCFRTNVFLLLAKHQSLILLILSCLFPYLAAHIHITSDLLFGLWCHTDKLVFQVF